MLPSQRLSSIHLTRVSLFAFLLLISLPRARPESDNQV